MAGEFSEIDGPDAPQINGAPLGDEETPDDDLEWPIGFIVMVALAALYLGWRLIQGVGWVFQQIG